jgi:hypothetical protein
MYNITFTQQTTEKHMTTAREELEARRNVAMDAMVITKCNLQRNVRYVRSQNNWMKITRDKNSFCFARGYAGQPKAKDIDTFPFTWVANWNEAIEKAKSTLAWIEI